jgi:hypothetical protein
VKIAYLLSCHLDPVHIARLCLKLTADDPDCAVFVHVDGKSDMMPALADLIAGRARIRFTERRLAVYWGGYSQVEATYELLRTAMATGDYDRFMILQGADYPIKSAREIRDTLARRPDMEMLRGCDATVARTRYLYSHARYTIFFDRPTIVKRLVNKITSVFDIRSKRGHIRIDGRQWHVFWGSAKICFTRALADLFLRHEHHPALVRYFRHSFVPEEMVFHTIAFNSDLRDNLIDGALVPEREGLRLVDTLGICYFEYPTTVTVFREADFERLCALPHFFVRKVTTAASGGLLDRIDAMHAAMPRPE